MSAVAASEDGPSVGHIIGHGFLNFYNQVFLLMYKNITRLVRGFVRHQCQKVEATDFRERSLTPPPFYPVEPSVPFPVGCHLPHLLPIYAFGHPLWHPKHGGGQLGELLE